MSTTDIIALPFVRARSEGGVSLWVVATSGDWTADCETGNAYGDALVTYIRATGDVAILGQVVRAMVDRSTGIEVGFFTRIAERLSGSPAARA